MEVYTIIHMALGAVSAIFGAHLSWAVTDYILKKRAEKKERTA